MTTPFPPSPVPAGATRVRPTIVPAGEVPERLGAVSFLGNVERGGGWTVPRLFRIVAFWGNVELDLSRVRIGTGTSVIELRCVMGNVEITLPPDLRLEFGVEPLLGSAAARQMVPSTTAADAPLVRIIGHAIAGSVEVRVVDPNAPGFAERLRRKTLGGVR